MNRNNYVDNKMFCVGIRQCEWLGRSQLIAKTGISYYIDGAHTVRSMQVSQRDPQCIIQGFSHG